MGEFTPLESKIIKQIEYYFGDINLQKDQFLLEQMKLDDGWVSLDVMLTFNRLSQLTTDKDVVINALKKVEDALVEVHDDKTKIRRSPDKPIGTITKEYLDARKKRTIYAKGFPIDASLDQLIEFFEKFGPTENVTMRKNLAKEFKGSCFVVYKTDMDAKSFLESLDTYLPDQELIRHYKQDYFKKKNEFLKLTKANEQISKKAKEEKVVFTRTIVPGSILDLIGVPEGTKLYEIKTFLLKYGKVVWVDFEKDKARIRFDVEGEATKVIELLKTESPEGKIIFKDQELQYKVLEGDEEKEHWLSVFEIKEKPKEKFGKRNGNRGDSRSSRGNRGNGRGKGNRRERRNNYDGNNKRFKNEKGEAVNSNQEKINE